LGERIHERHHLVAFLHREPAAGAKVVLHVDDDQGILDSGLDLRRRRHLRAFLYGIRATSTRQS